MKSIAYVRQTPNFDTRQKCIEKLSRVKCQTVHFEGSDESEREAWKRFVANLESGDTAVFISLSNAFTNYRDFVFFVKYCNKLKIWIRSIADNFDSSNEDASNTIQAIIKLPAQVFSVDYLDNDVESNKHTSLYKLRKLKQDQIIINMYNAGFKGREICEKAKCGKSSMFRAIHKYNIELQYPQMSRKKEAEVCT